ncbi:MAG: YdbL family protein [Pseudomonadota bacterium]|nr:YdbL family protein [Pseudomonadota bacterium]
MKFRSLALVTLFLSLMAFPALALDLHEARHTGLVGEKTDGYVAAIKPTADVQALVQSVNDKRLQEYTRISKQNGQPVDVVAKLAAQQIINNLGQGDSYQGTDGSWKTR